AVSCGAYVVYSVLYLLLLNGTWVLPIPTYVEQCLFPLLVTTAAAGDWGALSAAAAASAGIISRGGSSSPSAQAVRQRARAPAQALVQRMRIAAIRHRKPQLAYLMLPVSRLLSGAEAPATWSTSNVQSEPMRLHGRYVASSSHVRAVAIALQFV